MKLHVAINACCLSVGATVYALRTHCFYSSKIAFHIIQKVSIPPVMKFEGEKAQRIQPNSHLFVQKIEKSSAVTTSEYT